MNDEQPTVPYGYCHCGCGKRTNLRNGRPQRFLRGHHNRHDGLSLPAPPNPSGLCLCGCGARTTLARHTHTPSGHLGGHPVRYLRGHHLRVDRWAPEDRGYLTPCHIHQGAPDRRGYCYAHRDGRRIGAHRAYWIDTHGPVPDGLEVCHSCDVPPCVNVEHLFLGTHNENMSDMADKRRSPIGERNGNAKLTTEEVRAIRALMAAGAVRQAVAARFGVQPITVSNIMTGRSWRRVA